jgi:hypothetical protein
MQGAEVDALFRMGIVFRRAKMQKKVFLQRNVPKGGGGGPPYIKYLMISAVCLLLVVLIIPYLFKGKNRDVTKRPVPDRGMITNEVPKPLEPSAPERITEQVKLEPAVAPEAVKTSEVQSPPKPPEPPPAITQQVTTPQQVATPELPPAGNAFAPENAPPAPAQTARPAEPAPKDLLPKKSAPSEAPQTGVHKAPGKPGPKAAGQTLAAKPAPSTAKGNYAVMVGAAYKSRSEAEAVRKDLTRKGYSATVRTGPYGYGYSVVTSPSPEGKAYTLQEQMNIQGVGNTTIIRVAPVPGQVRKLPPGKPANGNTGISPDPGG